MSMHVWYEHCARALFFGSLECASHHSERGRSLLAFALALQLQETRYPWSC